MAVGYLGTSGSMGCALTGQLFHTLSSAPGTCMLGRGVGWDAVMGGVSRELRTQSSVHTPGCAAHLAMLPEMPAERVLFSSQICQSLPDSLWAPHTSLGLPARRALFLLTMSGPGDPGNLPPSSGRGLNLLPNLSILGNSSSGLGYSFHLCYSPTIA